MCGTHRQSIFKVKDFLPPFFSIFSLAATLDGGPGLSDKILEGDHPRTFPAKFGTNLSSGFKGEDKNVKRKHTDDGRSIVVKAHMTLRVRWAIKENSYLSNSIEYIFPYLAYKEKVILEDFLMLL